MFGASGAPKLGEFRHPNREGILELREWHFEDAAPRTVVREHIDAQDHDLFLGS